MKNTQVILSLALLICSFANVSMAESPTLPAENERAGISFEQAVKEYFKDCHATFSVMASKEGEEVRLSECVAYDTEQNCSIDYTGCNQQLETCRTSCAQPCDGCQESCANTCDDCKSQCKTGDRGCLAQCAIKRAKCRGGCLEGLSKCQNSACFANHEFCYYDAIDRLKKCDPNLCKAWQECSSKWPTETFEKCKAFEPKDYICAQDCHIGISPMETFWDAPSVIKIPQKSLYNSLNKACTKRSSCPSDYRQILPFLDSFCAGALTEEQLNRLPILVEKGLISNKSVGIIFNAYGAMYGYRFKKQLWMNDFYYGSGEWLPETCKLRMKSVVSAKYMPIAMTRLRDQVKRIWKKSPQRLSRDEIYSSLTKACTKKSTCPNDYRQILPFLEDFCGGDLTEEQLKGLQSLVEKKAISKESVGLVFNAYGAMYGYRFKKKLWMNDFFYGSGEWLPATCKSQIKSISNAKSMPITMTKLRDQVKKIWKRLK